MTTVKLQRPSVTENSVENLTARLVNDLMNSAVSAHKLHLKVRGPGSYAAHVALGAYYDGITDLVDNVVEQYQGCCEMILDIPDTVPVKLNSTADCVAMLKSLCEKVYAVQQLMDHSEIVNQLDEIKSLIDATKYKLLFLQ